MKEYDVIIIGAGISGITSAIYLKRANLNILIIEKEMIGGQLNKIGKIENYPGFLEISGYDLSMKLHEQLIKNEIKISYENVINIKEENGIKEIITNKQSYKTKYVIIATGSSPKKIGLENEEKLVNKGISYCAICDGPLYKNKVVAVIGGGNVALSSALFLSNIAKKVIIIHRSDEFKAEDKLIKSVNKTSNIEIKYNKYLKEIHESDGKIDKILLNDDNYLDLDGIFICIGQVSNLNFISETPIATQNNKIIVNESNETNVQGFYAVGDSIKKNIYQLTTATSEGTNAAINIIKRIKSAQND